MSDHENKIIRHPAVTRTPAAGMKARNDKRTEKARAASERDLEFANEIAERLQKEKLAPQDRAAFARNLGDMCDDVFGASSSERRDGLRKLFEDSDLGEGSYSLNKKRKRFIRFRGEGEEARLGSAGYGQYHASGSHYVTLARTLGQRKAGIQAMILRLVKGTSYDSPDATKRRTRGKAERALNDTLADLVRKLKPELSAFHEAILASEGKDDFLVKNPDGFESGDLFARQPLPCVELGVLGQEFPPILSIPLELSLRDVVDWVNRFLIDDDARSRIERHDHVGRDYWQRATATDEGNTFVYLALFGKRILLEIAAQGLNVSDTDRPNDELGEAVVRAIGTEMLTLTALASEEREDLVAEDPSFKKLTTQGIVDKLIDRRSSGNIWGARGTTSLGQDHSAQGAGRENQNTPDELSETILEVLDKHREQRQKRQRAVEYLFSEQPCRLHVTRKMVICPVIDRTTREWTFAVGLEPLKSLEEMATNSHDFTHEALGNKPSVTDVSIFTWLSSSFCVFHVTALSFGSLALGFGIGSDGSVYLVAFPAAGDPEEFPPHLLEPHSDVPEEWLSLLPSRDATNLLLADMSNVVYGLYENALRVRSEKVPGIGMPEDSIAADIRNDLFVSEKSEDEHSVSVLYSELRAELERATKAHADTCDKFERGLSWLKE